MIFKFVSRTDYRDKKALISNLHLTAPEVYVIPEGGTNKLALNGCKEIISECIFDQKINFWCVAAGTGGTAAGMITGLDENQKLIGFSVLKGDFMKAEVENLLSITPFSHNKNWMINSDYHFGGYAKFKPPLIEFINAFKKEYHIPLDPVYTGKLLYGVFDLIEKDFFPRGSKIMIIHTGGLQGIQGFNNRFGNLIQ